MGASVKRRGRAIALGLTRRSSGRRPADRLRAGVGATPLNFYSLGLTSRPSWAPRPIALAVASRPHTARCGQGPRA